MGDGVGREEGRRSGVWAARGTSGDGWRLGRKGEDWPHLCSPVDAQVSERRWERGLPDGEAVEELPLGLERLGFSLGRGKGARWWCLVCVWEGREGSGFQEVLRGRH